MTFNSLHKFIIISIPEHELNTRHKPVGADGTLHFQLGHIPLECRLQLVSLLNGVSLKTRYNQTFERTPLRLPIYTLLAHFPS
jgi:hypothetical protein